MMALGGFGWDKPVINRKGSTMGSHPAVHPHISSFSPSPVLVEQVLLPRSAEESFARLTSWQSLPAFIPVSPMLEPVRGKRIDLPSEQGDMLIGRGHSGGVEQVYLVISAVNHLLWTIVARPLRADGQTEEYQLTIAFRATTSGQCLMVVQIIGAGADFIDRNALQTRLDRIRVLLDRVAGDKAGDHGMARPAVSPILNKARSKVVSALRWAMRQAAPPSKSPDEGKWMPKFTHL